MVKRLPTVRETQVRSLGLEDSLEKEMATHSSTLVWKIPWMEERSRLQSMGAQRVGHNWATSLSLSSIKGQRVENTVIFFSYSIVWLQRTLENILHAFLLLTFTNANYCWIKKLMASSLVFLDIKEKSLKYVLVLICRVEYLSCSYK